jgi:hypothetical protein
MVAVQVVHRPNSNQAVINVFVNAHARESIPAPIGTTVYEAMYLVAALNKLEGEK